ncbi:hypothetical protein KUA24_6 [Vibrio phage HNL01]|nr:hypothetical protein KUA24_6 [Vibrio phage HNL01]
MQNKYLILDGLNPVTRKNNKWLERKVNDLGITTFTPVDGRIVHNKATMYPETHKKYFEMMS